MGIAALAVDLFVTGCSPIEVDAKNVEVTQRGIRFDAAPALLSNVVLSVGQSFELDSASVAWAKDLNANVQVDRVTIHPTSGVPNLEFIQSFSVAMSDASRSQKTIEVMTFKRTANAASGSDLQVTNAQPVDVTDAWSGDRVRVDLAASGSLPTTAWSVDVTLWLNGQISYHY
jgi:hypothetical protein